MAKDIKLPSSNMYLKGSGLDSNGNKIVKLSFPNSTVFSIQTGGNLPETSRLLRGLKTVKQITEKLETRDYSIISAEVTRYIQQYGSPKQKESLRRF